MGEYSRLNERLEQEQKRQELLYAECKVICAKITLVEVKLKTATEQEKEALQKELDELNKELDWKTEERLDVHQSIGELRGALLEMAEMDGLDDPYMAFDGDEPYAFHEDNEEVLQTFAKQSQKPEHAKNTQTINKEVR